jgi:hypothetical protein
MRRASWWWILSACALAAAPAVAGDPEQPETPQRGLVAQLPFVGTLTWSCDQQQRFRTRLTLPDPGATVFVGLVSDGRRVLRNRPVHPHHQAAGPFGARRTQTWTIRHHHKSASLTVVVKLRFTASGAACAVARTDIRIRRTPGVADRSQGEP